MLLKAFEGHVSPVEDKQIIFSNLSSEELTRILQAYPELLKPLLIASCVGGHRAIERDLGIKNLNTYSPRLSESNCSKIAEYLLSLLPGKITASAIVEMDRVEYVDKEVRASKGRWEDRVLKQLSDIYGLEFHKRRFISGTNKFEIDAAYPAKGNIKIGVDIKRIEAPKDLQKRCDEISGKAIALKKAFKGVKVATVVYYPFIQDDIRKRLDASELDLIVFADKNEASIEAATKAILHELPISL